MKKQIIVLGLAVLGAITVNHNANAQTTQPGIGAKMSTFTLADKGIKVAHTVLSAPGKAKFTLSNVSGKGLKTGQSFMLTLPAQAGLTYDFSTLKGIDGASIAPAVLANPIALVLEANSSASFIIDLATDPSGKGGSAQLLILKK